MESSNECRDFRTAKTAIWPLFYLGFVKFRERKKGENVIDLTIDLVGVRRTQDSYAFSISPYETQGQMKREI